MSPAALIGAVSAIPGVSLRATPLLAVILVVCAVHRRSAPASRHLALAFGLSAFLAIPVLDLVVPAWSSPVSSAASRLVDTTLSPSALSATRPGAGGGSGVPASPLAILAVVWGVGTLILLVRVACGLAGLMRLRRSAWTCARVRGAGGRARVPVMVTRAVDVPVAVGLIRPAVLLPVSGDWTGERRRAVLAHELEHVRRGDGWTLLLGVVVRALHWPNPLVWLAVRRLRAVSEEACDAAVLAAGIPPVEYAEVLVRLARDAAVGRVPRLAMAMARPGALTRRVEAVLAGELRGARRGRSAVLAGLLTLAIGALAAVRPAPTNADDAAARYAARYGIAEALAERILRAAAAERVDAALAFGLVSVESEFDPDRTSRRGAVGLTQILPATAAGLQPDITPEALRDPDTNLRLGFRLLRGYLERFRGDRERALLAYNVGPAKAIDADPARSSAYTDRVLRAADRPTGDGSPRRRPREPLER